eukprot:3346001-Rhodomonas_salina.1
MMKRAVLLPLLLAAACDALSPAPRPFTAGVASKRAARDTATTRRRYTANSNTRNRNLHTTRGLRRLKNAGVADLEFDQLDEDGGHRMKAVGIG